MNISLATAAYFSALVELALSVGMLVLWRREKAPYLMYWALGFLAFGMGSLLIPLRDVVTHFVGVVVANSFSTGSSILFYTGICLFFNVRRSWLPWMLAALVCQTLSMYYFYYIDFNASARIYVYSIAQALIVLMTLQTLFALKRSQRVATPEVVVITLLFFAIHFLRILGTSYFNVPDNFLASGTFQTFFGCGLLAVHASYALAFGNMHAAALHARINDALAYAQKKERQKVEVLGYIGHDLRAPLATISSYSALLLAKADGDQRGQLEAIQRSTHYQLDLIDELLEYAKSELQPLSVQPSKTELHQLMRDICDYAIALCAHNHNRFRIHAPAPLPVLVSVDAKRLQQVLLNLLSNAAKFTRNGLVELHISASVHGPVCDLHFSVKDNGIGIDLHEGLDIFSAFQQVQAHSGSTGLGLFIAQHVVQAMGGTLSASSSLDAGSVFSFQLSVAMLGAQMSVLPSPATVAQANEPAALETIARLPLDDAALQQLRSYAAQGGVTDIEHWIHARAEESELAQFLIQLRHLLDQFDFASIELLAQHPPPSPTTANTQPGQARQPDAR